MNKNRYDAITRLEGGTAGDQPGQPKTLSRRANRVGRRNEQSEWLSVFVGRLGRGTTSRTKAGTGVRSTEQVAETRACSSLWWRFLSKLENAR